jgi:hypothetical protein
MASSKSEPRAQRKRIRLHGCVLLALLALRLMSGNAFADTLTLQQGLNGYSGGADTFIGNGAYPENAGQNFGSCSETRVWCGHYASY